MLNHKFYVKLLDDELEHLETLVNRIRFSENNSDPEARDSLESARNHIGQAIKEINRTIRHINP